MKPYQWLMLGLLLLLSRVVQAEGNCPPGYFETNPPGAQGPVGCAPIPGYNNNQQQAEPQASPPQWVSRWMAIATDSVKGILGTATNMSDESQAEHAALADCHAKGGSDCKFENAYSNGCAAMLVGNQGYYLAGGATLDEATGKSSTMCKAATTNCHVYYSACSMPVRIQ